MTNNQRKQYLIDKKFQLRFSIKAVLLPFITIFIIGSVLFYYAKINNNYSNTIIENQDIIMDMFLSTPALHSDNLIIKKGRKTFKENIGILGEIRKNSEFVLYFIVLMIVIQSIIIFSIFVITTHRISGPIFVMINYLRDIREGKIPTARPLREKDELKSFHAELHETIEYLLSRKNK